MGYIINIPSDDINIDFRYTVYQILFPNGKKYIGCTSATLLKRINDHISAMESGLTYKIYNAMKKYGVNNLKFEILGKYKSKEEMFNMEKYYIQIFDTQINGYNITSGGEGCPGRIVTDEQRKILSAGQKLRFTKESERSKLSNNIVNWRKKNPEEYKEFLIRRNKKIQSIDHRKKMTEVMKDLYKNNPDLVKSNTEKIKQKYKEDPFLKIEISKSLGGKPIFVYKEGKFINCFDTLMDCGRHLNLSTGNIGMVLNGKRSHTGGYTFKRGEWDD